MNINKVILTGRLGKDPEVKTLESGKKVANFSLATRRNKEETDWNNIVVWGKGAEVIEKYVRKGDLLGVEGSLQTRTYEKDGQTRYVTEVVCYNIQLSSIKSSEHQEEPEKEGEPDLPF